MLRITIAALTIIAFALPDSAEAKKPPCKAFDQSGHKVRYNCAQNPTMQEELAAQEKIRANQPPKPVTQQCRMVSGNLVCK